MSLGRDRSMNWRLVLDPSEPGRAVAGSSLQKTPSDAPNERSAERHPAAGGTGTATTSHNNSTLSPSVDRLVTGP